MLKRICILLLVAAASWGCRAQNDFLSSVRCDKASEETFRKVADALKEHRDLPRSALLLMAARQFMGTEYVAGTLEQEPEHLTIDLNRTDCILFVEMCLSMVQTVQSDSITFEQFCRNTQSLRYRGAVVAGYTSRNHYTSGWIAQGEDMGLFTEVSQQLGGVPLKQEFSFMSTHPASYPRLADDPAAVEEIREVERELSRRSYWYLPQRDITALCEGVREGDIICFVTPIAGLDIGHVAIAAKSGGSMHFIHASSRAGKVVLEAQSIADYVLTHKSARGIRVIRLK